ncbi:helix-turn-helix domain-containing protein [Escherichia coli]|uniref:helix-turn-helix domain-containing protein n=1 Tax=Escherichia coli TaxID=562 RepID=UPI00128F83B8|nr:helix-turn-helix domain-containing protein [Escherichia coli]MQJ16232.1 helix-turn-helix domain-containing protein [Escherichia coli]
MGSCAAPSAKGDDKFITTDYLQQCHVDNPLLHILMDKIYDYERQLPEIIEFFEDAQRTPNDVGILRTLINQYNLTLSDLPEIGSKSMVSRVLSGERKLTVEHIRKLSARFGISPALFIG